MSIYNHRDANIRKTWLLVTLFFVLIIGVGWVFAQAQGDPTILYVAIIFSILMNVVSYWYSDKLVLKLTRARPASREEFFDLYTVIENLSITAGLPLPKVYVVDDSAPNAFATGRNEHHAVVAVTTGLLAILNRTELEGVIAHELSHIGNKDMLVSTMVVVLVGFVSLLSDFFLRARLYGHSDRNNRGAGIFMLIGLVLAIIAPLVATLIRLAISRKREFLADASGSLLTRYPEGLASALEKISSAPQPLRHAHNATAHLFIANPFGSGRSLGLHKLFMTHPPAAERIRALREAA